MSLSFDTLLKVDVKMCNFKNCLVRLHHLSNVGQEPGGEDVVGLIDERDVVRVLHP